MYCDVSEGARMEAGAMLDDPELRVPERLWALGEFVLERGWKDYRVIATLRDARTRCKAGPRDAW